MPKKKKKAEALLRSIHDVDREFFPNQVQAGQRSSEPPSVFGKRLAEDLLRNAEERLQRQRLES